MKKLIIPVLALILISLAGCGTTTPTAGGGGGPTRILMGGNTNVALNLTGLVSSFTGTASTAMTAGVADGAGATATFNTPYSITTDGTSLYVADTFNQKIRKIVISTGVVSTLAGTGVVGATDGPGATATFGAPLGITTDGTNLYVADPNNNKIRKIVISTGVVSTLAGTGTAGAVDGASTTATFNNIRGMTTDGTNLYVADTNNNKIRKIVISTGVVSTIVGTGVAGAMDGASTTATFNVPHGITTDGTNLYVADTFNQKIRKIVISTGVVSTLAGTGTVGAVDGAGATATFNNPYAITTDGTNLYIPDQSNHKIRKVVISTGVVSTLAGTGAGSAVDGAGTTATFNQPRGITTDGTSLYVADAVNNKIRKIQ